MSFIAVADRAEERKKIKITSSAPLKVDKDLPLCYYFIRYLF